MDRLKELLDRCVSRHRNLCPRQVLGVRMALAGASVLEMELPREDKKLLIIVETDGCFADGIEVASSCSVGHRTLRVEDYGKVAATFVQVENGRALRLAPLPDVRQRARLYAPEQARRYFAQLHGYQRMPDGELFSFKEVALVIPVRDLVSRPGVRVNCDACGEEIINERQVRCGDTVLCRGCAGPAYYTKGEPSFKQIQATVEELSR
jgi:formylmethanofuran dehydrogenase subunit E